MTQLNIEEAAARLRNGGLVIYPTETFFGIGCRVDNEEAIASVFRAKKRLLAMPLPVMIADMEQLDQVAVISDRIREDALRLAETFWPGPLSIMLDAKKSLSPLLTGGTGRVVLRISSHPTARELCAKTGCPLVSSSANISGRPAQRDWQLIDKELLDAVGAVISEGPAPAGGLPSTIVQPKGDSLLILKRPGTIGVPELVKAGFRI